ncbi:hypothetical protein HPB48_016344 [Haemaphysalis longicornis]|uniref:Uncharacterized protein n=1 Tax=Haemaphysalis longicornis TaxID=44386 RepID=A0A9J6H2F6_HAELO|nr:hypothetical protein HPB48_016344 [Haemaphysalis longicornis]
MTDAEKPTTGKEADAPSHCCSGNNNAALPTASKVSPVEVSTKKSHCDVSDGDVKAISVKAGKSALFIGGLATLLTIIVLALLFVFVNRPRAHAITEKGEFCCETEARQVMAVINASVDTCDDFYEHVCMRAADIESTYVSPMFKVAIYWKEVEMMGSGGTPAGRLISALSPVLSPAELLKETDVANFTAAIVEAAEHFPGAATKASALVAFFAEMSLVFKVPTLVSFSFSAKESGAPATTLRLARRTDCFYEAESNAWVESGLEVLNAALKTNVTAGQLVAYAKKVAVTFPNVKMSTSKHTVKHVNSVPFKGVSPHEWQDILKQYVFALEPEVKTLSFKEEHNLSELVEQLSDTGNQPVSVAYAVLCTARKASIEVTNALFDYHNRFSLCVPDRLHLCTLEDVMRAHMVSSRVDDAYLRDMLPRVRERVIRDAVASNLFMGKDRDSLISQLEKVKLMLPKEATGVEDVPDPSAMAKEDLAPTVLKARAYLFNITRAKVAKNIPSRDFLSDARLKRRGSTLYVPTNLYVQLKFLSRDKGFLVLPLVGVDMAAELWAFILESRAWSNETSAKIASFYACFKNSYFGSLDDATTATDMAHVALGLKSAQDVLERVDWRTPHKVDGTDFTQEQMLYYLLVYNQCSLIPAQKPGKALNIALRNDPEFARAFQCPAESQMSQRVSCIGK